MSRFPFNVESVNKCLMFTKVDDIEKKIDWSWRVKRLDELKFKFVCTIF